MTYEIEPVTDESGNKYFVLYTHGMFHKPTAVFDEGDMRKIALHAPLPPISKISSDGEIGREIKAIRRRCKLSQAAAAEIMGISRTYLSMIENGKADNVSLNTYRRLLKYEEVMPKTN